MREIRLKVLITGAGGQVGSALLVCAPAGVDCVGLDRGGLDLCDAAAIEKCIATERPAVVINCAAFTAVDKAESEPELARAVNATAPGILGRACAAAGARLVQVSTDYIFDGRVPRPYLPTDTPSPLNVYGATKLAGEQAVAAVAGLDWRIVRTSWVYSANGHNFVRTMLRLFAERDEVSVVVDQVGSPTSAPTLAQFLWRVALTDDASGVLAHYTDAGVASWFDFAVAILDEGQRLGLISRAVRVQPIGSEQYPTPARRPAYSVLNARSSVARFAATRPHWRAALREVLKEIKH